MTNAELTTAISARRARVNPKLLFSWGMIIFTIIPIVTFLFLFRPYGDAANSSIENQIIWMIMLFAQGHVGLSYLMYMDTSFHSVIAANKARFVYIPIALLSTLPFILMTSDFLFYSASFVVIAWNIWHFNKQNVGVCALVSISEGLPTPDKLEKNLISAACVLAIAAHYPAQFPSYFGTAWLHPALVWFGNIAIYPFLGVVLFAVFTMLKNRERYNFRKATFYLLALTMFGMVFVARIFYPGNPSVISMGYSTAHAIQYIIILYLITLSAGAAGKLFVERVMDIQVPRSRLSTGKALGGIVTAGMLLLWGIYAMKGSLWIGHLNQAFGVQYFTKWLACFVIVGLYVHFIIDAGAFKLSRKEARTWMSDRLSFIMKRG